MNTSPRPCANMAGMLQLILWTGCGDAAAHTSDRMWWCGDVVMRQLIHWAGCGDAASHPLDRMWWCGIPSPGQDVVMRQPIRQTGYDDVAAHLLDRMRWCGSPYVRQVGWCGSLSVTQVLVMFTDNATNKWWTGMMLTSKLYTLR